MPAPALLSDPALTVFENADAYLTCNYDPSRALCNPDNAANGLNDVHWVKVLVDPSSRDVFAFQPQIVPANRVAVPAPTS